MFRYILAAVIVGVLIFSWLFILPYFVQVTCPACGGKAIIKRGIVEIPCPYCKGRGRLAPYTRDIVVQQLEKDRKKEQEEAASEQATATAVAAQNPQYYPSADFQSQPAPDNGSN